MTRQQQDLEGTFELTNGAISTGNVVGMLADGDTITFGIMDAASPRGEMKPVATFTGALSGDRVSGSYTTEFGDQGAWEGTLVSGNP